MHKFNKQSDLTLYAKITSNNKVLSNYGHKRGMNYYIPALKTRLAALKSLGFEYQGGNPTPHNYTLAHKSLDTLYAYQKEAVEQLVQSPYPGELVVMAPGLGKTATSIIAAEILAKQQQLPRYTNAPGEENFEILVVCPKTLIPTWEEQIKQWAEVPDYVSFYVGNKLLGKQHMRHRWVITNYDFLRNNPVVFGPAKLGRRWPLVIVDESLLLKSRKARRYKVFSEVLLYDKIWLLSGSPTSKWHDDLWTQFNLMWPDAFGAYWKWVENFCEQQHNGFANIIVGNRPVDPIGLHPELTFRRSQEQVLPDLPDFIIRNRPIALNDEQGRLHDQMRDDFVARLEDDSAEVSVVNKIAAITRMLQLLSCPANANPDFAKVPSAKHDAILQSLEGGDVEFPMLVWTMWKPGQYILADAIRAAFPDLRVSVVNGDDKNGIELYRADKVDIMIISQGVGRYGLTLTNTKSVFYLDRAFDPDMLIQSMYRVKRIGLKHRPVVTMLDAPGTADDLVLEKLAGKMGGIATITNRDLASMMRGLRRR